MTDAGPVAEVGGCNNHLDVATPSPSHKGDAGDVATPSDELEDSFSQLLYENREDIINSLQQPRNIYRKSCERNSSG